MFCPKCGKMNSDDRERCSGCDAVLHEPKSEQPKKKGGMGKLIAIIAAAAVAVGASAVAVVSCSRSDAPVVAEACCIYVMY